MLGHNGMLRKERRHLNTIGHCTSFEVGLDPGSLAFEEMKANCKLACEPRF